MTVKNNVIRYVAGVIATICIVSAAFGDSLCSYAAEDATKTEDNINYKNGGGYAVTGQLYHAGYATQIYDATNGLPTSDANYILGASDGSIWIGGYSGIIRYDGTTFEKLDTADGMTSARAIYEDSKGRIWLGTNDNGVVVIEKSSRLNLTYKDGLPSSSIRSFAEDNTGDIYIATTAGVCYVDEDMAIHVIDDSRINNERILKLQSDSEGVIYGQAKNGLIFKIYNDKVTIAPT